MEFPLAINIFKSHANTNHHEKPHMFALEQLRGFRLWREMTEKTNKSKGVSSDHYDEDP